MAIKAKFDYNPKGGIVPELNESLKIKVSALLKGKSGLDRFLSALHTYQHIYVIHKGDRINSPTPAEMKKAAEIIARDAVKLSEKLSSEAGGIRPFLDYYIMKGMRPVVPDFWLRNLATALEVLADGCQQFIDVDYPKMGSDGVTPEKVFAWRVARSFREILNEEPQKYIPDDLGIDLPTDNREGKYARVLSACFIDANKVSPGNLREVVYWGVDHSPENN